MRRSVSALAVGFAGYGALIVGILAFLALGLGLLGATGGIAVGELALALAIVAVAAVGFGCPFLLTAWGLHHRRAWARWPALALALLVVGNAPLGTLLGGYTLYTLLAEEGVAELDS